MTAARGILAPLLAAACLPSIAASAQSSLSVVGEKPLDSDRQAAIDRYVTAEMARERIPGLTLGIYRNGWPLYLKGYGIADLEWQAPVGPDTRMQTGSLGKQFVAAAILRLAEQGKVDIDASITRYFPEAPSTWKPITVANLLSHTSGIGIYDAPELTKPGGTIDFHRDYTEDQLATAVAKLPLDFPVGIDWRYNNTNYMMLGIMIHRVTGQFYGDYLRDQFFEPLGMRATRVISDTDVIEHRASGYEIKAGSLKNQAWVSATFNATADGTLYTTVEDMARWDRALTSGSILKPASFKRMWTPFPLASGKPNAENYGFGWWIGQMNKRRLIEHSGSWQGFTSNMSRYPDDGLTVAVFVNLDSEHARPELITHVVAGLVSPELMPPSSETLSDDPARATRLRDFLMRAAAGQDMAADYAPAAEYKFDPADKQELVSSLPLGWERSPWVLIRKSDDDGGTRYGYRLGPAENTRLFGVRLALSGKVLAYWISPDPDSR